MTNETRDMLRDLAIRLPHARAEIESIPRSLNDRQARQKAISIVHALIADVVEAEAAAEEDARQIMREDDDYDEHGNYVPVKG